MNHVLHWVDYHPRRIGWVVSVGCVALLAFGLYLQHVVGLEPCPMCIVQRYALVLVALLNILRSGMGRALIGVRDQTEIIKSLGAT